MEDKVETKEQQEMLDQPVIKCFANNFGCDSRHVYIVKNLQRLFNPEDFKLNRYFLTRCDNTLKLPISALNSEKSIIAIRPTLQELEDGIMSLPELIRYDKTKQQVSPAKITIEKNRLNIFGIYTIEDQIDFKTLLQEQLVNTSYKVENLELEFDLLGFGYLNHQDQNLLIDLKTKLNGKKFGPHKKLLKCEISYKDYKSELLVNLNKVKPYFNYKNPAFMNSIYGVQLAQNQAAFVRMQHQPQVPYYNQQRQQHYHDDETKQDNDENREKNNYRGHNNRGNRGQHRNNNYHQRGQQNRKPNNYRNEKEDTDVNNEQNFPQINNQHI